MGNYLNYLHGEYDSHDLENRKQRLDDIQHAREVKQDIEDTQNSIFESMTEGIINEIDNATSEDFIELCRSYNVEDRYSEYLVNGATLRCTMATLDDFPLSNGSKVILEGVEEKDKNVTEYKFEDPRLDMVLHVSENGIDINNGQCYATVKDCVKDVNIIPPRCNCLVPVDRKAEEERINSDNERCKHGVCRHLMSLNDQWDNMLLKGNGKYQTKRNVFIKDGAPDININDMPEEYLESEDIEGITLTSILFCKHGGLICPVDSGQFRIITYSDTVFALACTIEGEHKGSLQWEQMKSNAEYIYNYLFDRGWSTEAICGVLGNMYEESKMNPGIWQKWTNTGLGYGLVQWSAAGEKYLSYINKGAGEVNNWAKADPKELMNSQLKYIMETMQLKGQKAEEIQWYPQMAWKYVDEKFFAEDSTPREMTAEEYITSNCNPGDLALIFQSHYERSGQHLENRINAANKWYEYFTMQDLTIDLDDFPQ